jgi:hypothetical protein
MEAGRISNSPLRPSNLPVASEPLSLEDDRAAERDGTVGRKLFKDLIACPVRVIAEPARLDGLGDLIGLGHEVTATGHRGVDPCAHASDTQQHGGTNNVSAPARYITIFIDLSCCARAASGHAAAAPQSRADQNSALALGGGRSALVLCFFHITFS